ncbi:hypothetical protein [Spirosoma aerophilum]
MSIRYLVYSLLIFMVATEACRNPLDGVTIGLKDPIQEGVVVSQFYDPTGNPLPTDNQITIVGPDASRVVTTLNTRRYKVNTDGNLLLAAAPGTDISSQNPLRFTLVVESKEYLTVVQPYVLSDPKRQTRSIRRISLRNPPRTLNAVQQAGSASTSGSVPTTFGLTTTPKTGEIDQATVRLESGTRLIDREGQAVGGNLTLAVMYTNARTDEATRFIPGGGILSSVAGRRGAPLGNLRFVSLAGSVTFQLYNDGYTLVKNLSPSARWTMDVNPSLYNVPKGRSIQVGDSIPLFSYDELTSRWQEERPGVVIRNPQTGRLEYQAEAAYTAAYVAGWTESICAVGPVFRVSSPLAGVDVNYLCKVIDVTTGQQVSAFYTNANNGSLISIRNQPKNRKLKVQIYDETDAWGKGTKGGLIAESAPGFTCDQSPVTISLAALPVPPVMKLEFSFSCPNGTRLDEASLPAMIISQYSEVDQNNWHDLITATRTSRKATSYKLKVGRRYDFRASTDGGATWPLRQNNYLVDKPEWTLKIRAEMYCK